MKDNWIKEFEQKLPEMIDCYICEQCAGGGSGAWEGKGQEPCSLCKGRGISIDDCDNLIKFISQVEHDAIEKTNKRWESELYRIANEWDDELSELQGLPPHQHNPKMWSIVTNILSRMKSNLLEDK